ncbi:MAG: hypothetical protein WAV23_03775, partial [Minisyncoccia bacterium]
AITAKTNIALAQTGPSIGCSSTQTTPCFNVTSMNVSQDAAIFNVTVKNSLPEEDMILEGILRKKVNGAISQTADADVEKALTRSTPTALSQNVSLTFNQNLNVALVPNTEYNVEIKIKKVIAPGIDEFQKSTFDFTSGTTTSSINTTVDPTATTETATPADDAFGCTISPLTWFKQCIVGAIYYLIWTPISWVTKLAASILDFFIYYSTLSTSYSGSFIGSAWATVRDIANIFFIIALLYVAIQTILGLGGHGGKKMIATIVIVALLINFSMFFTQVIIDGSNILAKVFYNHIDSKGANGEILPAGGAGQKSITVLLVNTFDPQTVIAEKAKQPGMTLIIILISIILMVYMIYIFMSVALLFVGRVAGLWVAMIMAPIAFASYTLPFDIPGVGHKKWWDDLLKQAFMAPLFIFFLYVILLLGKSFHLIAYDVATNDGVLDNMMRVVVPFLIIFVLLQKAKKLAVEYSGDIGEAITKAGSAVTGLALGVATGGAAMAMRNTIGKKALGVANDDNLKSMASGDKEAFARAGIKEDDIAGQKKAQADAQKKLAAANKTASKSFDFRQTDIGKQFGGATGLNLDKGTGTMGVGTANLKGGMKAQLEHEKEEAQKTMATYEISGAAAQKQDKKASDQKAAYAGDEKQALENAKTTATAALAGDNEKWKNEYTKQMTAAKEAEAAKPTKPFEVKQAFDEKKFKEEYEAKVGTPPPPTLVSFDEEGFKKKFKKDYHEEGKDLGSYGLTEGNVEGAKAKDIKGVVEEKDSKKINAERRESYAVSLEDQGKKDHDKSAIKSFWADWNDSMKKMATKTNATLAGAAIVGSGGMAAPLVVGAVVGGGFLSALKKAVSHVEIGGYSLSEIHKTNPEVVAAVRKGISKDKSLLDALKKMSKEDKHKVEDLTKHVEVDVKVNDSHAATHTADTHAAPAGGGGGHAH